MADKGEVALGEEHWDASDQSLLSATLMAGTYATIGLAGESASTGLRERSIEAETVHHQRGMGSDGIVSMSSGPSTKNKDKHSDSRIDNLDASPNSSVDLLKRPCIHSLPTNGILNAQLHVRHQFFNHVLDGIAELSEFLGRAKFYATHVQIDELKNTSNDARRAALLKVFEEITNIRVPTESFILGISQLGEAKLGGEQPITTESAVWGISKWGKCKWTASDNL